MTAPLGLLANTVAVGIGVSTPFEAVGGTAPYSYSVIPGNAGGTIDSFGTYTAPLVKDRDPAKGIDIVEVRDVAGSYARLTIKVCNPIDLVLDLLQVGMELDQSRVYLWNQKIFSPNDSGLFIAVRVLNGVAFGSTNRFNAAGESELSINMCDTLSVDIMSRDSSARDRKPEVLMTLDSDYARTQKALNNFGTSLVSKNFVDLSEVDGAAIPYRFNISINLQYAVRKVRSTPFYSSFAQTMVITDPDGGT